MYICVYKIAMHIVSGLNRGFSKVHHDHPRVQQLAVQFGILISLLWIGTTLDVAYNRFKDVDLDE